MCTSKGCWDKEVVFFVFSLVLNVAPVVFTVVRISFSVTVST